MEQKTIKLPEASYNSLRQIQALAIQKGSLPQSVINPQECPLCQTQMIGIEAQLRIGYKQCPKCGYGQPVLEIQNLKIDFGQVVADIGKAALVGLAIGALAYIVSKSIK